MQGGGTHLGCGTQPLDTRQRGERVHRTGGVDLEQGPQWPERSHGVARQTRCTTADLGAGSVWAIRPRATIPRLFILVPGHQGEVGGGGVRGGKGGGR